MKILLVAALIAISFTLEGEAVMAISETDPCDVLYLCLARENNYSTNDLQQYLVIKQVFKIQDVIINFNTCATIFRDFFLVRQMQSDQNGKIDDKTNLFFFRADKMSYKNAQDACCKAGGELAVHTGVEELDRLKCVVSSIFFKGRSKRFSSYVGNTLRKRDGSKKAHELSRKCLAVTNKKQWNTVKCSILRTFVCSMKVSPAFVSYSTCSGASDRHAHHTQHTYQLIPTTRVRGTPSAAKWTSATIATLKPAVAEKTTVDVLTTSPKSSPAVKPTFPTTSVSTSATKKATTTKAQTMPQPTKSTTTAKTTAVETTTTALTTTRTTTAITTRKKVPATTATKTESTAIEPTTKKRITTATAGPTNFATANSSKAYIRQTTAQPLPRSTPTNANSSAAKQLPKREKLEPGKRMSNGGSGVLTTSPKTMTPIATRAKQKRTKPNTIFTRTAFGTTAADKASDFHEFFDTEIDLTEDIDFDEPLPSDTTQAVTGSKHLDGIDYATDATTTEKMTKPAATKTKKPKTDKRKHKDEKKNSTSPALAEVCNVSEVACASVATKLITLKINKTQPAGKKEVLAKSGVAEVLGVESGVNRSVFVAFTALKEKHVQKFIRNRHLELPDNVDRLEAALPKLITVTTKNSSVPVNYTVKVRRNSVDISKVMSKEEGRWNRARTRIREAEMVCVFINQTSQRFSDYGVKTVNPHSKDYYCVSNHTTVFATMLTLQVIHIPEGVKVASYTTEIISVVSLVFTLAVLFLVKDRLHSNRTIVQINLCLSLMLLHLVVLMSDPVLVLNWMCEIDAVMIQFFLLSTGFWMLLEGLTLAKKTFGDAFLTNRTKPETLAKMAVGWGIPLLVVVACAWFGFSYEVYMAYNPELVRVISDHKYSECWMDRRSNLLLWGVLAPLAAALLVNLVILTKVAIFVFKMSKRTDQFKPSAVHRVSHISTVSTNFLHTKACFRAVLLLLPVLGIPWCFMFLQVTSTALMYVNVILNGLQGFFLMLIYCFLSNEVRSTMVNLFGRKSMSLRESLRLTSSTSHS